MLNNKHFFKNLQCGKKYNNSFVYDSVGSGQQSVVIQYIINPFHSVEQIRPLSLSTQASGALLPKQYRRSTLLQSRDNCLPSKTRISHKFSEVKFDSFVTSEPIEISRSKAAEAKQGSELVYFEQIYGNASIVLARPVQLRQTAMPDFLSNQTHFSSTCTIPYSYSYFAKMSRNTSQRKRTNNVEIAPLKKCNGVSCGNGIEMQN